MEVLTKSTSKTQGTSRLLFWVARSHQFLGWLVGGFILLWVISGLVMLWVPFPKLTETEFARWERWGKEFTHSIQNTETIDYDVWTVGTRYREHRPFLKIALKDPLRTELYWSIQSQKWVQQTTAEERFWNWVGAVPHWFYLSSLRDQEGLWKVTVWIFSLLGLLLVLCGWIWALLQRSRLWAPAKSKLRRIHSLIGLLIFPFLFLWLLSGFFSVPIPGWFASNQPNQQEALRWKSPRREVVNERIFERHELASGTVERRKIAILGHHWFRDLQKVGIVLWIDSQGNSFVGSIPRSWVDQELNQLRSEQILKEFEGVAGNDFWASGLDRNIKPENSPQIRLTFSSSPEEQWDVDLNSGQMVQRWTPSTKTYRILYRLLHTWDIPWLLDRDLLRKSGMILLLIGISIVGFIGFYWTMKRWRKVSPRSEPLYSGI